MSALLFIVGIIAFLISFVIYNAAASSIHQILGAVIGLAACVLIGSACIVESVNKVADRIKPEKQPKPLDLTKEAHP